MTRILALLDKPSHESFGMTPIIVEVEGQIRVLGLAPSSAARGNALTEASVQELIRAGHALATENAEFPQGLQSDTVALWLGDTFERRATGLDLKPPPLPTRRVEAVGGTFFLGPAGSMYPYLDRWTLAAFRRFRAELEASGRRKIAEIMQWVLPNRAESMTAAWRASTEPQHELELQRRTFARDRTIDELRADHEDLLRNKSEDFADLRVVLFTGGTGVYRDKVAQRFADKFSLILTNFRDPIAERVAEAGDNSGSKHILMERGQVEVDTSPLALTLAAVRPATPPHNILVIDGLRHYVIRETLKWLQPRKVYVVGVTAEDEKRRHRVQARNEDPERLFSHPTEKEIPGLTTQANCRVSETATDRELGEIFESVTGLNASD